MISKHQILKLGKWIVPVLAYLIVIHPFFSAYTVFESYGLTGFSNYDGFSYLWNGPVNNNFFVGRSLPQRIIFYVLNNDLHDIYIAQLLILSFTACFLFRALTLNAGGIGKIVIAILLSALFHSEILIHLPLFITSEPLYIASVLIFVASVLAAQQQGSRMSWIGVLVSGVLVILSKNTGPFIVVLLMLYMLVLRLVRERTIPSRTIVAVTILLLSCAAIRHTLTMRHDSSVHINAANNYFARVFPYPEKTEHFIMNDRMPTGSFIRASSGQSVLAFSFDGATLLGLDTTNRHNYYLQDDDYGFSDWIKKDGVSAWQRYMLSNIGEFLIDFRRLYAHLVADGQVIDPVALTQSCPPGKVKIKFERLIQSDETYPLQGGGAIRAIDRLMSSPPLNDVFVLMGLAVSSFVFLALFRRSGFSAVLEVGSAFMAVSIAMCFLSLYGDGMEYTRHLLPAYIFMCVGVFLVLIGVGLVVSRRLAMRYFRNEAGVVSANGDE